MNPEPFPLADIAAIMLFCFIILWAILETW